MPKKMGSPSGCCHPGSSRAAQKLQLAVYRSPCLAQLQLRIAAEQIQTSIGVAVGTSLSLGTLSKAGANRLRPEAHEHGAASTAELTTPVPVHKYQQI